MLGAMFRAGTPMTPKLNPEEVVTIDQRWQGLPAHPQFPPAVTRPALGYGRQLLRAEADFYQIRPWTPCGTEASRGPQLTQPPCSHEMQIAAPWCTSLLVEAHTTMS